MKKAVFIALLLAGCQTTEDRVAADDRQCQSYGVAVGSPAYVQCRMNLDTGRANVKASERFMTGDSLMSRIQQATQK